MHICDTIYAMYENYSYHSGNIPGHVSFLDYCMYSSYQCVEMVGASVINKICTTLQAKLEKASMQFPGIFVFNINNLKKHYLLRTLSFWK